jgi:hypothetical protein
VSESDYSRKHALECMRLAADSMQLAGDVQNPALQSHFLRMATVWSDQRFENRIGILGWKKHTRTQSRNKRGCLARTRTSRHSWPRRCELAIIFLLKA